MDPEEKLERDLEIYKWKKKLLREALSAGGTNDPDAVRKKAMDEQAEKTKIEIAEKSAKAAASALPNGFKGMFGRRRRKRRRRFIRRL